MTPTKELDTIEGALKHAERIVLLGKENIPKHELAMFEYKLHRSLSTLPAVREAFERQEEENAKLRARLDRLREPDEEMIDAMAKLDIKAVSDSICNPAEKC